MATAINYEEFMHKNFERLCRFCLKIEELVPIKTNNEVKENIRFYIDLDIEVNITEKLPNFICENCLHHLNTWHLFREKCLKNYKLLLKHLENKQNANKSKYKKEKKFEEEDNGIKLNQNKNKTKKCCPVCGVLLKDLKTHLLQHKDVEGKPFKCKSCNKSYCRRIGLQLHVEREHLKIRYTCEKCAKVVSTKTILKEHLKLHNDEKNYKCDQCNKEFKSYKYLFKHRQWHTGIRKFVCSFCGKAFRVGESLKQHIRIHTGERPYPCKECGKSFQTPHHLKQHGRVHTGAKPFKCSFCSISFGNKKSRDNHQNIHVEQTTEIQEPPAEHVDMQSGISTSNILDSSTIYSFVLP